MKKILLLLVSVMLLSACSFGGSDKNSENKVSELLIKTAGAALVVTPDYDLEVVNFILTNEGGEMSAQVGGENFSNFKKVIEVVENDELAVSGEEYIVLLKFQDGETSELKFSLNDSDEKLIDIVNFYNELVGFVSNDIE